MPELDRAILESYLSSLLGEETRVVATTQLGEERDFGPVKGFGYGVPVLIECETARGPRRLVLETMSPGPFGHENMSDRAQMLLWDHAAYNRLPRHVRSIDVAAFRARRSIVSLGDAEELFLLTEFAEGKGYIEDLARILRDGTLEERDLARADALCDYLVGIHAVRGAEPGLYARRIRELVGHGECVMGLADSYPASHEATSPALLEEIEHLCVRWRWRIKWRTHRLRQVHGDFHPRNILFREGTDLTVLDRSRGEWGDPADDVTSITMNYLFFSLRRSGRLTDPFEALFRRFWERYIERSGDREILEVAAPFFAFRGLVLASPVWYPDLPGELRQALFRFVRAVLEAPSFDPARVDHYLARPAAAARPAPKEGARRRPAFAVWLTGLPASGKSTVAEALVGELSRAGLDPVVLESDALREILTPAPRYDDAERETFYGAMVHIGALLAARGVPVIFDATANRRAWRDRARARIGEFLEVYVECPLATCEARDPKGIYRRAREGKAGFVPGVQSVYEPPASPELVVRGDSGSPAEAAGRIAALLRARGLLG